MFQDCSQPFFHKKAMLIIAALAVVFTPIFIFWPSLDLWVSGLFYSDGFWIKKTGAAYIRKAGMYLPVLILLPALVSLLLALVWPKKRFIFSKRASLLILLSFTLGPGLLVNGVLKQYSGRARPITVEQFGGQKEFTPAFIIADQCEKNCSFVSGEGSSSFWMIILGIFGSQVWRKRLLWTGLGIGFFFGVLRIAFGGHFLSDVIFSEILTYFVIVGFYHLLYRPDIVQTEGTLQPI